MSTRLTDKHVSAIRPAPGKRLDVFDAQEPGLLLRVSDAGRRTWFFRYRLADGRQPRMKLGTYPATGIGDARRRVQEARRVLETGEDPAEVERRATAAAKSRTIRTFHDLIEAYFEASEAGAWKPKGKPKKSQTIAAERALYDRHVKREIGRRPITEIGRAEVKAVTRAMLAKGITTQSNHAHALMRQAFSYAVDEELVPLNPVMGLAGPAPKNARERVLSDDEFKRFWVALDSPESVKDAEGETLPISAGVAIALKLTALLLQRRAEVATMRLADLDLTGGLWVIPNQRAKNGKAHAVPLGPASLALLRSAIFIAADRDSPYVFPCPRNRLTSIHPDALTRAMGRTLKALGLPLAGPHDLRRTGASILASERGGVSPFLVSQILNHTTDGGGGSATTRRHYNLHLYAAEKRKALEKWEETLCQMITK